MSIFGHVNTLYRGLAWNRFLFFTLFAIGSLSIFRGRLM